MAARVNIPDSRDSLDFFLSFSFFFLFFLQVDTGARLHLATEARNATTGLSPEIY